MSIKLIDISEKIEKLAPLCLAEPWDNCGWQIFNGNNVVNKILICLTVTMEVVDKAIKDKFDLIISHHPLTIDNIKNITPFTLAGKIIMQAVKADMSVYSAHTNLDKATRGVNDILAKKLNLLNVKPILPEKSFPEIGLGRIGQLRCPLSLDDWITTLKNALNIDDIRVVNNTGGLIINTIALCGGSGMSLIKHLPDNVDLYLTGDIKYHDALDALNHILVDASHLDTEQFIVDELYDYLNDLDVYIETFKTNNPWKSY